MANGILESLVVIGDELAKHGACDIDLHLESLVYNQIENVFAAFKMKDVPIVVYGFTFGKLKIYKKE